MKNYFLILVVGLVTIIGIARADEGSEFSQVTYATENEEAIVVSTLDMKELRNNLDKARRQMKIALKDTYPMALNKGALSK